MVDGDSVGMSLGGWVVGGGGDGGVRYGCPGIEINFVMCNQRHELLIVSGMNCVECQHSPPHPMSGNGMNCRFPLVSGSIHS